MRRHGVRGLVARPRRAQAAGSRHAFPAAPGLLNRQCTAAARPNQVWLADLTCAATGGGWPCMAAIMDLHTRKPAAERRSEIAGWSMRGNLRAGLAASASPMAAQRQRPGAGLARHSDRGAQHACGSCQAALDPACVTPSMSRRASPLDNAPMESFFRTLKTGLVHHRACATRGEAKRGLFAYVEGFHNRQRLHSALDRHTPGQAERRAARAAQPVRQSDRGSSTAGRTARHVTLGLMKTCGKLGVSFFCYLGDRSHVLGAITVPPLPDLVRQTSSARPRPQRDCPGRCPGYLLSASDILIRKCTVGTPGCAARIRRATINLLLALQGQSSLRRALARRCARGARGGRLPYRGVVPCKCRSTGSEGEGLSRGRPGSRRPVRDQERPQSGVGQADCVGDGRGCSPNYVGSMRRLRSPR